MYQIDTITVPVDASRSSRAAWALARTLAGADRTIDVLHVVDLWPAYMEQVLFPYAPLGEDSVDIEHELREAGRRAIAEYHDVPENEPGPRVAFGALKPTLIEEVAKTASQLVIAGAHGEGGPLPDTIGSVALRLLMSARRPVLLTRGLDAEPKLTKILAAIDLTEGSERVFEVAARLALLAGAELEVVHVLPDPLAGDHARVLGSVLKFDRRKVAAASRDRVEAMFERLFRTVEPNFSDAAEVQALSRKRRVTIGDPADTIVQNALDAGVDLIVVGSQNPMQPNARLGRVAGAVVRRSPTHVCVVPMAPSARLADDD